MALKRITSALNPLPGLNKPIVLFDGVCVICNAGVNFVLKRDKPVNNDFRIAFCRVQTKTGAELLKQHNVTHKEAMDRFRVLDPNNNKMYVASAGALRIALYMPFPFPLLYIFMLVPPFLRNFVYDIVATNRYKWFGIYDTCIVYNKDLAKRFVDSHELDLKGQTVVDPSAPQPQQ